MSSASTTSPAATRAARNVPRASQAGQAPSARTTSRQPGAAPSTESPAPSAILNPLPAPTPVSPGPLRAGSAMAEHPVPHRTTSAVAGDLIAPTELRPIGAGQGPPRRVHYTG